MEYLVISTCCSMTQQTLDEYLFQATVHDAGDISVNKTDLFLLIETLHSCFSVHFQIAKKKGKRGRIRFGNRDY